jgi:hypothetical protein
MNMNMVRALAALAGVGLGVAGVVVYDYDLLRTTVGGVVIGGSLLAMAGWLWPAIGAAAASPVPVTVAGRMPLVLALLSGAKRHRALVSDAVETVGIVFLGFAAGAAVARFLGWFLAPLT